MSHSTDGSMVDSVDDINPSEIDDAIELARQEVADQTGESADAMDDETKVPSFPALSSKEMSSESDYQRIPVPPHRYSPLKVHWLEIYQPIVEHMKMQIRFNPKKRCVELRVIIIIIHYIISIIIILFSLIFPDEILNSMLIQLQRLRAEWRFN